jgi:hypothetical protein
MRPPSVAVEQHREQWFLLENEQYVMNPKHASHTQYLLPMGNTLSAFTMSPRYPATATGCSGMVIPATAAVPSAPSGTFRTPFPRMPLIIPPPSDDCLKISNGSAGNTPGSDIRVSCEPMVKAAIEASIPKSGPAEEKSNIACLFLGGSLKLVTVLVTPVMMDGTNVGKVGLIFTK